ncbi:hypothetical protein AVEN_82077-1 [Araneus ventricosus]|uniref:Uncharacterized protein n=1 Tax=Araneus ventricosus TaxID=182803 RepID=A0A4Y2N5S4_ARAVE|nr:hypothetical protein AVEN_82077-1 [Araneus ventricosus]
MSKSVKWLKLADSMKMRQMTRMTPELAPPFPNFRTAPAGSRLATTYDLTCSRSNTLRIFTGIRFRAWNSAAGETLPLCYRGPLTVC